MRRGHRRDEPDPLQKRDLWKPNRDGGREPGGHQLPKTTRRSRSHMRRGHQQDGLDRRLKPNRDGGREPGGTWGATCAEDIDETSGTRCRSEISESPAATGEGRREAPGARGGRPAGTGPPTGAPPPSHPPAGGATPTPPRRRCASPRCRATHRPRSQGACGTDASLEKRWRYGPDCGDMRIAGLILQQWGGEDSVKGQPDRRETFTLLSLLCFGFTIGVMCILFHHRCLVGVKTFMFFQPC